MYTVQYKPNCTSCDFRTGWKKWVSSTPGKQQLEYRAFHRHCGFRRVCAGCFSTKHPHCLSNCLMRSTHNLLLTNLQLKYIKLVWGYLQSKNITQYEALCCNVILTRICFSCLQTPFTLFVLPEKSAHSSFLPWSWIQPLPVLQTPSYKGQGAASMGTAKNTASSHLLPQQWNSLPFMGEKGEQQEAGKQSVPLKDLFSSEKYLHLKICFSEQTRLSLIAECCCFVRGSPGRSEKRLTSSYSYPASPPPCLFWPVFQTFSRFLSLTQAEFSVSERGTSPWEQLLENKPPNKANLYKQVKWCLNYYKYYPGYNRAEFICPFVTMKQTPGNASQELLSLLNPFFCDLLARLLTAIPSKCWKTSPLQGEFYSVLPRTAQPWNTKERVRRFWENSLLSHIPLSKDLEVRVAGVCLIQMMLLIFQLQVQNNLAFPSCNLVSGIIFILARNPRIKGAKCSIAVVSTVAAGMHFLFFFFLLILGQVRPISIWATQSTFTQFYHDSLALWKIEPENKFWIPAICQPKNRFSKI